MTILRNQCEKQLIPYLEELRKRKHAWAIWMQTSRLQQNSEEILTCIAGVADRVAVYGENTIYLLCNGDALMVTEHIDQAQRDRIIQKITSLLDPQEQGPQEQGQEKQSPLCEYHSDSRQFKELSLRVADLRRAALALPVAEVQPETILNPLLFRHALAARSARKKLCVLVVEDQRFSCKLVVNIVNRQCDYVVAENGRDALYLYEAYAPDIVFLDINIPLISGQEVLRHITTLDSDSFVVMLTASQMEEDVERALKHAAMGYILKPFSKQKIDNYIALYHERFVARGIRSA